MRPYRLSAPPDVAVLIKLHDPTVARMINSALEDRSWAPPRDPKKKNKNKPNKLYSYEGAEEEVKQLLDIVRRRKGPTLAVRGETYSRLKLVGEDDVVRVDGAGASAYGPWPGGVDASMATALSLGAARVAAATAGSMCIYPATVAGSEDAWEVRWRAPGSNVVRQDRFLDYGASELTHFAARMAGRCRLTPG